MSKHITVWISGASLLISVIALCIAAYRTPDLAFDYQGVLVGILSALVTILIGWNIYSTLDLKREIQKVEKAKQTVVCHSEMNAITTFISIAEYYGKEIGVRPKDDPAYRYIYFNLSVILHAATISEFKTCNSFVKAILETIAPEVKLRKEDKVELYRIIGMIPNTSNIDRYVEMVERIANLTCI